MTHDDASSPAAHERRALAQALQQAGSTADTLCEGWNAHDLAAHIVARDSRPDAIFGQELPLVADRAAQAYQQIEQLSFLDLVRRIQNGPPQFSPARLKAVGDAMNTVEFFVHTEDVLRAGPDGDAGQTPRRSVPESVSAALWRQASRTMFLAAARRARRRITYLSPGVGAVTHGRSGDPMLVLEGAPEELVLWAFGREQVADVTMREL